MKGENYLLFLFNVTFFLMFLIVLPLAQTVKAATIFVPDDYDTIQAAINASEDEDTVSVADGTYYENITFPVPPTNKNITLISENGPEFTIIDGDNSGTVVLFPKGSNSILKGFTITNGSKSGSGGGILVGSGATPTINNCIIINNLANSGGGIACGASSAPFITDSTIQNNLAIKDTGHANGGGIHIGENSTPTITNCIFKDNTSEFNGGALAFDTAEPLIVNCIFDNNIAYHSGGAISFNKSAPKITNCTFSNNTSIEEPGGAMACDAPLPETVVTNSIFWGDFPAEIACDADIISVTYSNIQGGPFWPINPGMNRVQADRWPGTGNINADPRFLDQTNGDFYLSNDSPCIDAGDNSDPNLQATDINGDDRKFDDPAVVDTGYGVSSIVDMGAFEKYLDVESPPPIEGGNEWTPDPSLVAQNRALNQASLKPQVSGSGSGGGGGGGGIFGDILKSSVTGYHLDGLTKDGVQIYMPVTQGFKALKGAQEYIGSFAPNLARNVREFFDYLEQKADANKEGFLYKAGTYVFPILGKIAKKSLELIGQEQFVDSAYKNTTISIDEFKKLEKKGLAIAPKVVKEVYDSK